MSLFFVTGGRTSAQVRMTLLALCAVFGTPVGGLAAQDGGAERTLPSQEEMWRLLQAQQAEIAALRETVDALQGRLRQTEGRLEVNEVVVAETREHVAATADALAEVSLGGGVGEPSSAAASTRLGGYGELHLNLSGGGSDNVIDFHRWVLFLHHDFSDRVRLVSELELEHSLSGDGAPGEVELEQAYVEFEMNPLTTVKGGLFLVPVGLLNEHHEPAFFYGVERNLVEKRIIPTTWWEAGVAVSHRWEAGWSLDLALTSGLDQADGVIRSGRQKVAEAVAESAAVTARVQYTGVPGLRVGGSVFFQPDLDQSGPETVQAALVELHADWRKGPFGLKALYAQWLLDGEGLPATAEEQLGYYVEPSYRFATGVGEWGIFGRFSHYEYQRNATAFRSDELWEFGLNYWPIENVVLKWDYQYTGESEELAGDHWFNFGLGYHF